MMLCSELHFYKTTKNCTIYCIVSTTTTHSYYYEWDEPLSLALIGFLLSRGASEVMLCVGFSLEKVENDSKICTDWSEWNVVLHCVHVTSVGTLYMIGRNYIYGKIYEVFEVSTLFYKWKNMFIYVVF